MEKTKIAAITIGIAVAALAASVPAAARATATPAPARSAVNPNTIVTDTISESPNQVTAFWTTQRVAAAKDMDVLPDTQPVKPGPPIPPGPVQSMPPAQPAAASAAIPAIPAIPDSLPGKHSRQWSKNTLRSMPAATVGKLWFNTGSGTAACTATIVSAPNKDTIWTAAHCVSDGNGHWFKDFVFQPARHGKTAPWGGFIGKAVAAPLGYVGQHLANFDYAAIALFPSLRGKAENLAGSQGWIMGGNRYNWPDLYIFGYPGKLRPGNIDVDATILRYCTGPSAEDSGKLMIFFHCDMAEGSSGGPLIYRLNRRTGGGWLVGNVSIGAINNYDRWSPQLDAIALTVLKDVYRR
jgi:V8-like Glu-specific endopeptidase